MLCPATIVEVEALVGQLLLCTEKRRNNELTLFVALRQHDLYENYYVDNNQLLIAFGTGVVRAARFPSSLIRFPFVLSFPFSSFVVPLNFLVLPFFLFPFLDIFK